MELTALLREERSHIKEEREVMKVEREMMEAKIERLQAKMDQQRDEAETQRREEAEAKLEQMRTAATPVEEISEQRLAALQVRLEALHEAKLLTDDEVYALEDTVADFVELQGSTAGVVTLEAAQASEVATRLLKLAALSEGVAADGMFARQARRKHV